MSAALFHVSAALVHVSDALVHVSAAVLDALFISPLDWSSKCQISEAASRSSQRWRRGKTPLRTSRACTSSQTKSMSAPLYPPPIKSASGSGYVSHTSLFLQPLCHYCDLSWYPAEGARVCSIKMATLVGNTLDIANIIVI